MELGIASALRNRFCLHTWRPWPTMRSMVRENWNVLPRFSSWFTTWVVNKRFETMDSFFFLVTIYEVRFYNFKGMNIDGILWNCPTLYVNTTLLFMNYGPKRNNPINIYKISYWSKWLLDNFTSFLLQSEKNKNLFWYILE